MKCFECDNVDNLHKHHIIPRVLGGNKTVILCSDCHGLIHGLDFTNHGTLIRIGLEKARRKKKLGRPKDSGKSRNQFLKDHKDIVKLLEAGCSVRKTAKITNKGNSTVQRVKKIL